MSEINTDIIDVDANETFRFEICRTQRGPKGRKAIFTVRITATMIDEIRKSNPTIDEKYFVLVDGRQLAPWEVLDPDNVSVEQVDALASAQFAGLHEELRSSVSAATTLQIREARTALEVANKRAQAAEAWAYEFDQRNLKRIEEARAAADDEIRKIWDKVAKHEQDAEAAVERARKFQREQFEGIRLTTEIVDAVAPHLQRMARESEPPKPEKKGTIVTVFREEFAEFEKLETGQVFINMVRDFATSMAKKRG